ncbi:MAG: crotonobetainyl-CoA hydratase [Henriciella sp.]
MSALKITADNGVLEIILDRPKANAIDAATSREMGRVFAEFRDDKALRVAIITGAGEKIFSAGWDLKAAAEGESEQMDYGVGGFAGFTEMFDLYKPVIAAVNGIAVGGGFEIALASDIIVAAEHAAFALPETSIGVMADAGGVQRLPRRIPHNVAMEMLLTGRRMSAEEAASWGLVNAVVPMADLMSKAREYARIIADGAPLSVTGIKQVVQGIEGKPLEEAFNAIKSGAFPIYDKMLHSEDHIEGPTAFAEKRAPVWKGR